jgi:hypothetical protein
MRSAAAARSRIRLTAVTRSLPTPVRAKRRLYEGNHKSPGRGFSVLANHRMPLLQISLSRPVAYLCSRLAINV